MNAAGIEGIRERMRWVLENQKISRRTWSEKAGLAQAHVGMILRGDIGEEVSAKVLDVLARAAGVSSAWLQTGRGQPYDVDKPTDVDDPIPERAEAIRFARANGLPEDAIERVRGIVGLRGPRPTPEQWYERIKFEIGMGGGEPARSEDFAEPRASKRGRKR